MIMRYFIISLMFFAGFSFSGAIAQESERTPINESGNPMFTIDDLGIAFLNVNIVSLNNNEVLRDMVVTVKGNRIQEIVKGGEADFPAGSRIIEADGKFLVHGIIPPNLLTSSDLNFDLENNFGRFGSSADLSEGDLANLILVTSNPLENRNRIDNYDGIMIRGIWYNRETVLKNPEEVKRLYP